eukprot:8321277-Pyramimonas_sp.AAC.1
MEDWVTRTTVPIETRFGSPQSQMGELNRDEWDTEYQAVMTGRGLRSILEDHESTDRAEGIIHDMPSPSSPSSAPS